MTSLRSARLSEFMAANALVRMKSRFEDHKIRGYVRGIGPKFVLIQIVNDRIWFDGYECFRIADIRGLKLEPHTAFIEAAIRARYKKLPKPPRIDLADVEKLILSAASNFPLVTIHNEEERPDVCWIGRVKGIAEGILSLTHIDPNARWEKRSTKHDLKAITRVGFGASYEAALHLVGGNAPEGPPSKLGRSAK